MSLDAIDQAFVARWQARGPLPPRPRPATEESAPSAPTATPEQSAPAATPGQPAAAVCPPVQPDPGDAALVARLLAAGGSQWSALADEVEAARVAGHRTVGITGGERGEGRTTLVAGLAHTLRGRGRDVVVLTAGPVAPARTGLPSDGGRQHDKRIVLIDAGIWFPPGPIRRQRLMMASLGCDAAILVRRADRAAAPAWATALAALGVTVLGEVVTFAPAAGDAA